jgi:hypothetical protein
MNAATVTPGGTSLNQLRRILAFFPVIAGMLLLLLLPIGTDWGIQHPAYDLIFAAHLTLLIPAVVASLVLFVISARRATVGPLLLIGSALLFLTLMTLIALAPVTSRDALIHHLAIPRLWLEAGSIVRIDWHEWSYYPMLINLAFTSLLKWHLEALTSLYHACYLVLLAGSISSFILYKTKDYDATCLGFLATISLPALFKLGTVPLVDLGLAFFSAHAICHYVYWVEGRHKSSHLVLMGLAWGLALGSKYNGLLALGLFAPLGFLFALRSRVGLLSLVWALILSSACFVIAYAPWAMRNYAWTGNPLYPLLNQYFAVTQAPQILPGLAPLETRALLYGEPWYLTVLIPLRMLVFGQDNVPARFDGVLSPILIFLLVPAFFIQRKPWAVFMALLTLLYLVFALLLNSARVRYLAPVLGPAIILSVVGIYQLSQLKGARYRREVFLAVTFLCLLWSVFYASNLLRKMETLQYYAGLHTRQTYLREYIPEYEMIEYMNQNMSSSSRTYLVNTGNRFYYYKHPVFSGGHFSAGPLIQWVRAAESVANIRDSFVKEGITHIMVATHPTRSTMADNLDTEATARWNDFFNTQLTLIHSSDGYSLWELRQ